LGDGSYETSAEGTRGTLGDVEIGGYVDAAEAETGYETAEDEDAVGVGDDLDYAGMG
jgi:hypothetical protein